MKKVVRSIAVVALMLTTASGFAKEPKLSLTPNEVKSVNFEMDMVSEQTLISIVDTDGAIIYTQKIAKGDIFSKKFDLKNLPEGSYFLEVEDTLKETTFTLTVDNSEIRIAERKEKAKPIFRKQEGKVFLNLLNLEREVVKIKVIDSNDRILFEETITEELLIEKVFNFEDAFEDRYTVVVQNSKDIYFENVIVK